MLHKKGKKNGGNDFVYGLFKNSSAFVHYKVIIILYIILVIRERGIHSMYEPEQSGEDVKVNSGPEGYTGETNRATGEYHYKNGYTQRIYSDAHYVPEDESTTPPRYYTPHEKAAKETKKDTKEKPMREKKQHRGIGVFGALCMCLACAMVGGLCGASVAESRLNKRLVELEAKIPVIEEVLPAEEESVDAEPETEILPVISSTEMTPAAIYDEACSQVVGITTDVTYTNLFGRTSSSAVTGTGFFVTEEGYILTNYHVIEYGYEYNYDIEVMTHDGNRYKAQIVGVEETNDIALLKVDIDNAVPVTIGDSDQLYVGDEVYPVGNPLGELEFSMTFGRVSALDRFIATEETEIPVNMFQFDAAVNSGNSGGPVYNSVGDVVGIVTAKYKSSGVEGIGFAIPINDAVSIANELMQNGYVSGKAKLGLSFDQRFSSIYSRYYGLPQGAYVYAVEPGSCAEAAGIMPGDIITGIGGYRITSHTDVESAVKRFGAGDTAEILLYRNGENITTQAVFDEYVPSGASALSAQGSGKR